MGTGPPVRSTEFDPPHPLHAGVAQLEEHRTRNAEAGFRIPPLAPADVAQWKSRCTVSNRRAFDSLRWLQTPCKHRWRCAGSVIRKSQFDSDTGLHGRHALRLGATLIRSRRLVRFQGRPPGFVAVSSVTVRSHKAGPNRVRLPAPLPWASRSTGGRHACTVQIGVQFPGGPPIVCRDPPAAKTSGTTGCAWMDLVG